MLCRAHSPAVNLDWNPSNPSIRLRHGRRSFFLLSHASSFTCLSMATTDSEQAESSYNPKSQVTRSRTNFGRLKVQRVKISRPVEETKEEKRRFVESVESDGEFDGDSDTEIEVVRRSRASSASSRAPYKSPQRLQREMEFEPKQRREERYKGRRWGLSYDSPELSPRAKFGNPNEFFSRKSFRDVGCAEFMIDCLKKQQFQRPSHIQAMAFAPVKQGKSCILADQSGSGKTLAYLTPVIERLREEEIEGISKSAPQSPRLLVLVPTAELASQVLGNCRSISKNGVPFRSMVVTGGFRQKTQLESLQECVDVVVATPGRFKYLIEGGFLQLTKLRCAVLDEVDILFNDEDFEPVLQNLMNSAPVTTQYLFVTATLPVGIYNKLVEAFPDCEAVMGPGMHRTSAGLEEVLVDCSGGDETEKSQDTAFLNKKTALLQLVEGNSVPKTIVFCNKIETCRKVENALKRFDRQESRVQVLPFHAAMTQESRLANIKEFTNSRPEKVAQFLVCTDRASRGMDFAEVDHVVLFDFPRDPSEYVRRVGRTARGALGKGMAFVFVVGKQVSLARRIIERNQKGHPLHEVPSAYELSR